IPMPMQMLAVILMMPFIKFNVPIGVGLVWITNPITIPPIFYGSYKLGAFILGQEILETDYQMSIDWFINQIDCIWQPFLLGCFIAGVVCASIAYATIRLLWRLHIVQHIKERQARRNRKS
ncbi:MAG: DUF2062 domain-containing protein, partial [Thiotrichaceae bacterium]|nr:DUF2062 domain-containing protein [Thiotrichaceae bacterium]